MSRSLRPHSFVVVPVSPVAVEAGTGSSKTREGARVFCSSRSEAPNVGQTRGYAEQEQIAVKSRGNRGPATLQLFDSRSGRQLSTVMAFQAANGPAWAKGMAE